MSHPAMNWGQQVENCVVYFSLPLILYVVAGPLFRSVHPTGMLNWQGRRWRKGLALALLLLSCWLEISELHYHAHVIPTFAFVTLLAGLGMLFLLVVRWWWLDWQEENAARDALIERAYQEGCELVLPPMGRGKKVWNWILIVYGAAGLLGGLCAIILHLLGKY